MSTLYRTRTTAVLVEGEAIAWHGPGADAPAAGRIVELGECLLTPAFVDAHVHTTATGLALTGLDLHGTTSLRHALDRIEAHARAGRGRVVLGTGWDETTWPEGRAPSRAELDRASYGGAVYLARVDVHSAVVSSALLAAVPGAAAQPGYDASGHLRLGAHHAVRAAAYAAVTPAQRRAAQRATRRRAAELGIGCLQEMAGPEVSGEVDLADLLALAAAEPGPDVLAYWGELDRFDLVAEWGLAGAGGDLFCDGALGSHTAALSTPYADAATCGTLRFSAEEVTGHVRAATRAGVQAGFHVIGDAAIDQVVTAVRTVAAELGADAVRACRHRLEHAEMPTAAHIAAMAELAMVASVQPAFDAAWGGPDRMYARRLGEPRAARLNPLAALAAAGVLLALGSDTPVTPLDPWGAVAAAMAHRTPGAGLGAVAALAAATTGGWAAARAGGTGPGTAGAGPPGTLSVGAPATFAAWRRPAGPATDVPAGFVTDVAGDSASDLAGGVPPVCALTAVRGTVVHDETGATA